VVSDYIFETSISIDHTSHHLSTQRKQVRRSLVIEKRIDSGILQYTPKGSYYEGKDEQFTNVFRMWQQLLKHDRILFCLVTLLNGTGFSKGMMNHLLLSSPPKHTKASRKELAKYNIHQDFEEHVMFYNLKKEAMSRALKNLMILTGSEGDKAKPVNNTRTRRLIFRYIFDRPVEELDSMAINFKPKLKKLIRHALGKYDLHKLLQGDYTLFQKYIGRYQNAQAVLSHLFNVPMTQLLKVPSAVNRYPKIEQYNQLKKAAEEGNIKNFTKLMKNMPLRTVVGFRNFYKLPVDLSKVYEESKMGERESIQLESAAKRSGAKKVKIDYKKQDLYDLWKALYFKMMNGEYENLNEISEALAHVAANIDKIDIGEVAIVLDASHSMFGSEQRPLHPLLTALSVATVIDNVKDVVYVGGTALRKDNTTVILPSGGTALWRGLVDAVATGAKKIVVISDGYENSVKGAFDKVYQHFKGIELLHINPVYSADAKSGTTRQIAKDVHPMPLDNYKFLETEVIFNQMIENPAIVKNLLANKYHKMIGGR
jgi:hypothetical protein